MRGSRPSYGGTYYWTSIAPRGILEANFGDGSSDDEEAGDDESSADEASIEERKRSALEKVKERKLVNAEAAKAAAKAGVENQRRRRYGCNHESTARCTHQFWLK